MQAPDAAMIARWQKGALGKSWHQPRNRRRADVIAAPDLCRRSVAYYCSAAYNSILILIFVLGVICGVAGAILALHIPIGKQPKLGMLEENQRILSCPRQGQRGS
jgi:hypothetical protein